MSIASEISRLQGAKADIKTAIEGKGVTVPSATKLDDYANYIDGIPQGTTPTGTKQISVTSNGTQTENVSGYASAQLNVAVPNSYSASDEGKVVSNGALVAQTSDTVTQNDTYDTTLINSLTVNVSGGGGGDLEAFMTRQISDYEDDYTITIPARFIGGSFPNLKRIKLNEATVFGGSPYYQFQVIGRSDLVMVLPKCTNTVINCCNGSTSLNALDFLGSTANQIQQQVFYGCSNLETLIIRQSDGVMVLQNINAFTNSPFASGKAGGTLYVPQSLISSYQSASNWSTILGYANNQIKSIESTHTDPNAPIDLTLYYVDGTPISS